MGIDPASASSVQVFDTYCATSVTINQLSAHYNTNSISTAWKANETIL